MIVVVLAWAEIERKAASAAAKMSCVFFIVYCRASRETGVFCVPVYSYGCPRYCSERANDADPRLISPFYRPGFPPPPDVNAPLLELKIFPSKGHLPIQGLMRKPSKRFESILNFETLCRKPPIACLMPRDILALKCDQAPVNHAGCGKK
jgi:hypothetical protein